MRTVVSSNKLKVRVARFPDGLLTLTVGDQYHALLTKTQARKIAVNLWEGTVRKVK